MDNWYGIKIIANSREYELRNIAKQKKLYGHSFLETGSSRLLVKLGRFLSSIGDSLQSQYSLEINSGEISEKKIFQEKYCC